MILQDASLKMFGAGLVTTRVLVHYLVCVHVDPHQEDELGHEETAAQVLVNGGPGALDLAEEPEGENAHGQTDDGDDHPQLGDAGQDDLVGDKLNI